MEDLSGKARESLERYYKEMVFPVLTPMAIDASRPFPFLANKSLNIALELRDAKDIRKIAFIQVPSVLPRVIPVKGRGMKNPSFSWKTSSWHTAGSSSKD